MLFRPYKRFIKKANNFSFYYLHFGISVLKHSLSVLKQIYFKVNKKIKNKK